MRLEDGGRCPDGIWGNVVMGEDGDRDLDAVFVPMQNSKTNASSAAPGATGGHGPIAMDTQYGAELPTASTEQKSNPSWHPSTLLGASSIEPRTERQRRALRTLGRLRKMVRILHPFFHLP